MSTELIIPGLQSSGPAHWQTWIEDRLPQSTRVVQRDWKTPNLPDWAGRVRRAISQSPDPALLVAHSFGALAAIQAASDHAAEVVGALLVAPADPDRFGVADFLPREPLPFPVIVVASSNDPWMSLDVARAWSSAWGAEFINLGRAGHINAESGFGPWPQGLALLERLRRAGANNFDDEASTRIRQAADLLAGAGWQLRAPKFATA